MANYITSVIDSMDSFALIVPTFNAGKLWQQWITAYQQQSLKANKVIIIDSSSTDETRKLAKQAGFFVHQIAKESFNHGGTRNLTLDFCNDDTEILVFLTQDAILADPYALENLLKGFSDPQVAAICGRQLPHLDANPLAAHARLFNYPDKSQVKSISDIPKLGIKTAFMSNSFAAYRRSVFEALGGFPQNTILAEDMSMTAKMLLSGYKVAYCAEATVYHSHNYSLWQELQRYFDTGVFQQQNSWIQDKFGKASNEGKKFVLSELNYLWKNKPLWIPKAICSTFFKYVGFKLGLNWFKLPRFLVSFLSMHKAYWQQQK